MGHRSSHRLVPRKQRGPMPDHDLFSQPRAPETIDERFAAFHATHPEVLREIIALAEDAARAGRQRLSMKLLVEVVRWYRFVQHGDEEFKVNNSFTSRYTRLLQEERPDLAPMFATRELRSA